MTGTSHTFEDGDRVVHGQQGEVTGPATLESHKGKGVAVRFPGNRAAISCDLDQVRRKSRRAATRSSPLAPRRPSCPSSQPITHYFTSAMWAYR